MKILFLFFAQYMRDVCAATGVEYGLFLAGISLAIIVALFSFGDSFQELLERMAEAFGEAYDDR